MFLPLNLSQKETKYNIENPRKTDLRPVSGDSGHIAVPARTAMMLSHFSVFYSGLFSNHGYNGFYMAAPGKEVGGQGIFENVTPLL